LLIESGVIGQKRLVLLAYLNEVVHASMMHAKVCAIELSTAMVAAYQVLKAADARMQGCDCAYADRVWREELTRIDTEFVGF
jgi:hypothetical protein